MDIIAAVSFLASAATYIAIFAWRRAERSRQIVLFYQSMENNQPLCKQPTCGQFDYQREAQNLPWK